MIDYHLHTLFCNHAVGGMEQYIQSAIDLGLREVCFLDHLTIQETEAGLSMTPQEIPYYFHAVQVLKQKYRDRISVKALRSILIRITSIFFRILSGHLHLMSLPLRCIFLVVWIL
jgi:HisJ family histidinol phosphate phosphatase